MLGTSKHFVLAASFPRVWQTNIPLSIAFSVVSIAVAAGACATLTSDLRPDAIPDSIVTVFRLLFLASGIATLYWFSASTRHFRVGAAGYEVSSPSILLLFVILALLWLAPFFYAYWATTALKSAASVESASLAYFRLLRVAALFNAEAHYEPLTPQPLGQLEGFESFTVLFVDDLARDAAQPAETFAPGNIKGVLLGLLTVDLPRCSRHWSLISKKDASARLLRESSDLLGRAQTESDKEIVRSERAKRLDQLELNFESATREFRQCVEAAIQNTRLDRAAIVSGLRLAQRNAYLVQYAHKSFGHNSANYRQFFGESNFAAPELFPFGPGDVMVLAGVVWLMFLISILYLAAEYVDLPPLSSMIRNVVMVVLVMLLVLSSFGSSRTIPPVSNNYSFSTVHDTLAAVLHWPSLALFAISVIVMIWVWFGPSTGRTRFMVLMAFVCLPIAFAIEVLNVVNSLTSIQYQITNCPKLAWIVTDQLHCALYSAWQPLANGAGNWLAHQFNWSNFAFTIGGRASVAAIISIFISWPICSFVLVVLKREYVRPRDR